MISLKGPKFDGTITLGNVLTVTALIIPLVLWQFNLKASVENNAKDIRRHDALLEKIVETQNLALRNQAVLQQRFDDYPIRTK